MKSLSLALTIPVFLTAVGVAASSAEHWISAPPPPEVPGDEGHWWLNTDTITRDKNYAFFSFERSSEKAKPPLRDTGVGRMAMDCNSGNTLSRGVCTGTCPPMPAFPKDWVESARYPRGSFLFRAVCRSRVNLGSASKK